MIQTSRQELNLVHKFNADKKRVFDCFTNKDILNKWWGPEGSTNTALSLDFRVGGIFHFKMVNGSQTNYGRFIFTKIQPHDLLEFSNAFADANANPIPAPFDISLPLEILYTLRFTEQDGVTTIDLHGRPYKTDEDGRNGFVSILDNMAEGFHASFSKLAAVLVDS